MKISAALFYSLLTQTYQYIQCIYMHITSHTALHTDLFLHKISRVCVNTHIQMHKVYTSCAAVHISKYFSWFQIEMYVQ